MFQDPAAVLALGKHLVCLEGGVSGLLSKLVQEGDVVNMLFDS